MRFKRYEVVDDLLYTREHEWVKFVGNIAKIGVTDYAAKTLTDIVYVTLPRIGSEIKQFQVIGTLESVKTVAEVYSPISGIVTSVNQSLELHPELVNQSPYAEGWLAELKPTSYDAERTKLLSAEDYIKHLESITGSQD